METHSRLALWKRVVVILLFVPASIVMDMISDWEHRYLASGPYLPDHTKADAAVVLGYALKRDGSPTLPLRQRVDAGSDLFEQKWEPDLSSACLTHRKGSRPLLYQEVTLDVRLLVPCMIGGSVRGRSEAAAMLEYALKSSHRESKPASWILEEQSTSTRENALFSLQIGERVRWASVVVATNPFHQLRSRLVFQCAAKQVFGEERIPQIWLAHVKYERSRASRLLIDPWIKQWNFWRELAALAYYYYMGWLC